MLVFLGDGMPQKSSSNLERTTSQSGEAAMIAGRVGKSSAENENIRPGSYLNPLNRPVRTRMPGGVAGDAEDQPPRPYADFRPAFSTLMRPPSLVSNCRPIATVAITGLALGPFGV